MEAHGRPLQLNLNVPLMFPCCTYHLISCRPPQEKERFSETMKAKDQLEREKDEVTSSCEGMVRVCRKVAFVHSVVEIHSKTEQKKDL
jgi:hypothetical protein